MITQNIKYILWVFLFFLVFVLFSAWQGEKDLSSKIVSLSDLNIDDTSTNNINIKLENYSTGEDIVVKTELLNAKINSITGDIYNLSLNKYSKDLNSSNGITVFNRSVDRFYYVQSGLLSKYFFDDGSVNTTMLSKTCYNIDSNPLNSLVVIKYEFIDDVIIYKVYTFRSYSYEIGLSFYIQNNSVNDFFVKHYGLIRYKNNNFDNSIFSSGVRAYEGSAVFTSDKPYKKVSFDDIGDKRFSYVGHGGWIAFVERYFISVLIPNKVNEYIYTSERLIDNFYSFKYLTSNEIKVVAGDYLCFNSVLFVGPKTKLYLNNLYKGLELAIDYGVFWPIADPIFFLLSYIYLLINNWGFSIVLVTLIIKLLFFNLSSISYRSMGNMKKLQPRLDMLKDQYKDDKKQFGNAVMELYKKEKVNPLSGCLPVLIQIPVFISLYYVLLESIELRHAPFIYWITDLSSKDVYYVLPVIMSLTMFVQQKLNPPIHDQLQAKIMLFLPVVFLFIFLQFPSGLILYWIVNNLLSILQQWVIVRQSLK